MNDNNYLAHHGVKGMKWGVRKYVNPDGTMTEQGKIRYGSKEGYLRSLKKNRKVFGLTAGGATAATVAATAVTIAQAKRSVAKMMQGQISVDKLMRAGKANVLVGRIAQIAAPVGIIGVIATSVKANKVRKSGSEKAK